MTTISGHKTYAKTRSNIRYKIARYPIKKILFSISDSITENLGLERLLFWLLRSKRFLKNGRSYVIKCWKKS